MIEDDIEPDVYAYQVKAKYGDLSILFVEDLLKEIKEIREYHIEWGKPPNLVFRNKIKFYEFVLMELNL